MSEQWPAPEAADLAALRALSEVDPARSPHEHALDVIEHRHGRRDRALAHRLVGAHLGVCCTRPVRRWRPPAGCCLRPTVRLRLR